MMPMIQSFDSSQRERVVRAYFPSMSPSEIEEQFGIARYAVQYTAKKIGVSHTPETAERLLQKKKENLKLGVTHEAQKKARAKRRRIYLSERCRVLSGMGQKTKIRIATIPTRTAKALWRLRRSGYYTCLPGKSPYQVYYDDATKRSPKEHLYIRRYGLSFDNAASV